MSDRIPDKMSANMSDMVMPRYLLKDMSGLMADQMSDRLSERMSENISD